MQPTASCQARGQPTPQQLVLWGTPCDAEDRLRARHAGKCLGIMYVDACHVLDCVARCNPGYGTVLFTGLLLPSIRCSCVSAEPTCSRREASSRPSREPDSPLDRGRTASSASLRPWPTLASGFCIGASRLLNARIRALRDGGARACDDDRTVWSSWDRICHFSGFLFGVWHARRDNCRCDPAEPACSWLPVPCCKPPGSG